MGKIKLLNILGMIILLFTGCLSEADRAEKVLQKHLKERYGEEFVIYGMGKRAGNVRRWYEAAVVYPKSYIGTIKENDSYYWGKGFVELNNGMKGGDTYGKVLLNESANKFYGKKLEELFGKNYLAVLNVEGGYISTDFEEEMKDRKKLYEEEPEGRFLPLSGGIYIFGRVENDKDREWYRKQIYEFIQFMKETGTFEYVDLDIEVIDIRRLYDGFNNSDKIKKILINNRKSWENNEISAKDSDNKRKEILNTLNVLTKNEVTDNISKINRSTINESPFKWSYYTVLLYSKIYSPKYILNNHLDEEKKKEYNKITDIEFDMGGYY